MQHQITIVASEVDEHVRRVIDYLQNHGIAVNFALFSYFADDERSYLARAWLVEPTEANCHPEVCAGPERAVEQQGLVRADWAPNWVSATGPMPARSGSLPLVAASGTRGPFGHSPWAPVCSPAYPKLAMWASAR